MTAPIPYDPRDMRPHPCPNCGTMTIFRQCDPCFQQAVREAAQPQASSTLTDQQQAEKLEELDWLVSIGEVGGKHDGDEFKRTLELWNAAPTVKPPTRFWSGMCLWCAREICEATGETHTPPLHRIRTCYRHRKALLALLAWQRNEKFGPSNGMGGAA